MKVIYDEVDHYLVKNDGKYLSLDKLYEDPEESIWTSASFGASIGDTIVLPEEYLT